MRKKNLLAVSIILFPLVIAFFVQYSSTVKSHPLTNELSCKSENKVTTYFLEDFNLGLDEWSEQLNSGGYSIDTSAGYLSTQSSSSGALRLTSISHLLDWNKLIDADLYSTTFSLNAFTSVYFTFYSNSYGDLGFVRYYLSDNVIWSDTSTQKNILVTNVLDSFETISNYITTNDRNLSYCLNNYLTGINQEEIDYYYVNIYAYTDGATHQARFDNIKVYSGYENDLLITDFSYFQLETNSSYIISSQSSTGLDFYYDNETTELDNNETYEFQLGTLEDCSDFYVSVDVYYNYTSNESIGSFGLLLSSIYDYEGNSDPNNTIGKHYVEDYLNDSSGQYSAIGYPYGIADKYSTGIGSAGITGNITIAMNRTDDFLSLHMYNLSDNSDLLYWHSCNYGLNQTLSCVKLYCHTGGINSTLAINMSNFYGYFEFNDATSEPTQNDANSGRDASSDFAQAMTITTGVYYGSFPVNDDIDYYKFYTNSYRDISITLSGSTWTDFDLTLYDEDGNFLVVSSNNDSSEQIDYGSTTYGYYFLKISKASGEGYYAFSVSITDSTGPAQNDGDSGGDASELLTAAVPIDEGEFTGSLPLGDPRDYYKITIELDDIITLTLMHDSNINLDVSLVDIGGSILTFDNGSSLTKKINYLVTSSIGFLYLEISKISGNGDYNFEFEINAIQPLTDSCVIYLVIGFFVLVLVIFVSVIVIRNRRSGQPSFETSQTQLAIESPPDETVDDFDDASTTYEKENSKIIYSGYTFGLEDSPENTETKKEDE